MSALLNAPASLIWGAASALARMLSRRGLILKPTRLPSRVISVGNLVAGGAGKTPLVAQIAREALDRGLTVCILTRGYGGAWESSGGVLAPASRESSVPAPDACGDEPALLHDLVPEAWIGVGANRITQYDRIVQSLGAKPDVVVLDDGFQHWRIRKDLEVVALTSDRCWQRVHRDWKGALKYADLIVWTKGDPHKAMPVRVEYVLPTPAAERSFWLVSGLADGRSALGSLRDAGWAIARHLEFPDHARYAQAIVQGILESAATAGARVVLTGKDWVKWRALGITRDQVEVVEPSIAFRAGRDLWERRLWG